MASDWFQLMKRGDFEAAWRLADIAPRHILETEWRLPRHQQRIWNGAPLAGRRVLVRCYHGLGDTIQFLRYLPWLVRIAREVTVWIQPALIPLLAGTPNVGRLLPLHDGTPDVSFDVDVEIMELARVFRSTTETIPRHVPYIRVAPLTSGRVEPWVGIAWTAGDWDPRRSIPVSVLRPLLQLPHTRFVPLHPHHSTDEAVLLPGEDRPAEIAGVARLIASCAAIVSVDTMAAHLAGALGAPTCLMLQADADWRWMENRSDSPWYPSLLLFRQSEPGDWLPVVDAVRAHLLATLAAVAEPSSA